MASSQLKIPGLIWIINFFFFFINWQQGGFLTFMHIAHGADETRLAKHPHRGHIASASAALLGASALLVRFESHDVA